jgi:hypothetical protein
LSCDLSPVGGPAAWKGAELDYRSDGLHVLSEADVSEIDGALAGLKSLGDLDLPQITRSTFPLPTLGKVLADLCGELHHGRGFVLIRGLDRGRYSADDLARIYYGLGVHLGQVIPQSGDGELLGHVLNVDGLVPEELRGYRTNRSMNMHCDGHDIVGLLCLQSAKRGGASRIASAVAVHDRMVAERPDLAQALYEGMKVKRMEKDAQRGDGRLVTAEPVALFAKSSGEFMACIHPAQVRDAAASGAFEMTSRQAEALDTLCALSASAEFYLDMEIGEGDIQFLNNRLVVHGRTTYEDHEALDRRRHLLRLWLLAPTWPARPANQQDIFALDDLPNWARHRTPGMEFPSRYAAQMAAFKTAPESGDLLTAKLGRKAGGSGHVPPAQLQPPQALGQLDPAMGPGPQLR